jgi:Pirin C-terminal cupin domain
MRCRRFFPRRRPKAAPPDDDIQHPLRRVTSVVRTHKELGPSRQHLRRPNISPTRFSPFVQLDHSSADAGRPPPRLTPCLPPPRGQQALIFPTSTPGALDQVTVYLDPGHPLHAKNFLPHLSTPASRPTSTTTDGSARLTTLADSLHGQLPHHTMRSTLTPASPAAVYDLRLSPRARVTLCPPGSRVFVYLYSGAASIHDGAPQPHAVTQGSLVIFEDTPANAGRAIVLETAPSADCLALVLCGEPICTPVSVNPTHARGCEDAYHRTPVVLCDSSEAISRTSSRTPSCFD